MTVNFTALFYLNQPLHAFVGLIFADFDILAVTEHDIVSGVGQRGIWIKPAVLEAVRVDGDIFGG